MAEDKLVQNAEDIRTAIKIALYEQHMTQRDLASFIGEGEVQVSRAINGDPTHKGQSIRKKIYKVLGMEESK